MPTPELLELFKVAFNYGVPTGLLVLLFIGLWLTTRWVKAEVVKPLMAAHLAQMTAHLSLVSTLQDALPRQTEQLQAQTGLMKNQINQMDDLQTMTAIGNGLLKENAVAAQTSADRIERAVQVACRYSAPVIVTPVVAPQ